jgi:hypothetical protein
VIADLYLDIINLSGAITPLTFLLLNYGVIALALGALILVVFERMKLINFALVLLNAIFFLLFLFSNSEFGPKA